MKEINAINIMESYLEKVNKDGFHEINAQIIKKIASGESTSTNYISVYFDNNPDYEMVSDFGNVLKRYYEKQGFIVDVTFYSDNLSIKVFI